MHWTDPVGRWPRVAALLERDGVFASFGGQVGIADSDLDGEVRKAREPFLADDEVASPDGTPAHAPMQWPGSELLGSADFTDVRQVVIERRPVMSAADYLGHLSTISAYRMLPDDVRVPCLREHPRRAARRGPPRRRHRAAPGATRSCLTTVSPWHGRAGPASGLGHHFLAMPPPTAGRTFEGRFTHPRRSP